MQQKAMTETQIKQLAARFANLFMLCYRQQDISGMHVTFTAFTHTLHGLDLWTAKKEFQQLMRHYLCLEKFPEAEMPYMDWLLNHYLEQENHYDESFLLPWYQTLDDEWMLRKKLKQLFPEKSNTQLSAWIVAEQQKTKDSLC